MDRALKERVMGAVVLVVIAVLVVPVFLDGPATEAEIISEPVTLPGQNEQSRKRQTIVLERDRDQPLPASARQSAAAVNTTPAASDAALPAEEPTVAEVRAESGSPPATEKKSAEPAPAPQRETAVAERRDEPAAVMSTPPATDTESATGMWAVQLGSFSNEENAERLAATLREQGYAAFLSELHTGSGDLHRVRIGPQSDRDSAEAVAAQLGRDGHQGQVVPHP